MFLNAQRFSLFHVWSAAGEFDGYLDEVLDMAISIHSFNKATSQNKADYSAEGDDKSGVWDFSGDCQ